MSTGKLQLAQIVGNHNSFYDRCYQNCSPDFEGFVISGKAAEFLRRSGLDDVLLSKIWNLSDRNYKGKLDYYEFCMALKLIALAQSGLEVKLENLGLQCPAPKMLSGSGGSVMSGGNSNRDSPTVASGNNDWAIPVEDQARFARTFESLAPLDGRLSGEKVREALLNWYSLPVQILGRVWTLADVDSDGYLDRPEFQLAMYLVEAAMKGKEPPPQLPADLIPPGKRGPGSLRSGIGTISTRDTSVPWVVGKLEKEQYDTLFHTADTDHDGYVSGLEVRSTFVQSGLSQPELAKIWDLCDISRSGRLNSEQFALAMHLVNQQIKSAGSRPIPSTLTPEMIPPSFRGATRSSISDLSSRASPLSLASFGIKPESDEVYREIEAIQKERHQVEQTCRQLELDLRQQQQEVSQLQQTLARSQETSRQLAAQKEEAQQRLDELAETHTAVETELAEVRARCSRERQELEHLRQQAGAEAAEEERRRTELKSLQAELEQLVREERRLADTTEQARRQLAAVETEVSKTESAVLAAEKRNDRLEGVRTKLAEALAAYEAALLDTEAGQVGGSQVPDAVEVDELLVATELELSGTDVTGEANSAEIDDIGSNNKINIGANGSIGAGGVGFSGSKITPSSNNVALDPFSNNDPFSLPDSDPFSFGQDPFSQDPFSPLAGQSTAALSSETAASAVNGSAFDESASAQNSAAFSIGNVDDLFKNMSLGTKEDGIVSNSSVNKFDDDDIWGTFPGANVTSNITIGSGVGSDKRIKNDFGDAFGDVSSLSLKQQQQNLPPPRPTKGPLTNQPQSNSGKKMADGTFSESDQLAWAKQESVREAKQKEEEVRRREQADIELAIKLSKAEMQRHQQKAKSGSSGGKHHK